MRILNFLRNDLKISSSDSGCCKEFIIRYPRENGKCTNLGAYIVNSILCSSSVIVKIDTSLCFAAKADIKILSERLRSLLKSIPIDFQYRIVKSAVSGQNPLGKLFQFSNKNGSSELIVFELPIKFVHKDLLDIILNLGCEIFVPFENSSNTSVIQEIFNGHYDDNEDRFDRFKFVMFLSNYLEQAALRTKHLSLKDVESICNY